jgi:hypothetical protein
LGSGACSLAKENDVSMMKLVKKLIASSKAEAGTVGTWMELERTSEMESGMMVVGL